MFSSKLRMKSTLITLFMFLVVYLGCFFLGKIFNNKRIFDTELFESVPANVNWVVGFNTLYNSYSTILTKLNLEKMDFMIDYFVRNKVDFAISCIENKSHIIQAKVTKEQEVEFMKVIDNASENKKFLKKTINDFEVTIIEIKRNYFVLFFIRDGIISISSNYDLLQLIGRLSINDSYCKKYTSVVDYWNELKKVPAMKLIVNKDSVNQFFLIENLPNSFLITEKIFSNVATGKSIKPDKIDLSKALYLNPLDSIYIDSLNSVEYDERMSKYIINKSNP